MSCCTETKYNLFLKLTFEQKLDLQFQVQLKNDLKLALAWTDLQARQAVNWAVKNQTFVIAKDTIQEITKLSRKLASYSIPHSVKLSK